MAKIALCIIATGNYIDFVPPLLKSADKYFLDGHDVHYNIFTDAVKKKETTGGEARIYEPLTRYWHFHPIQHQPWPAMTLNRYHIITSCDLSGYEYVFYIDADSLFVAPVGDEILNEMTVISHPGYYMNNGGAWETDIKSFAYVPKAFRKHYVCGGFNGGSKFLHYAINMKQNIDNDATNGITAVWHDESHLNNVFAHYRDGFNLLPPDYMMPESIEKRKAWGISNIQPKILALEKEHKLLRK
jgi:histo-blood group ABO system transferase